MIYGILTQTNIGHLFVAGVLPGLLGLALYMLVIYIIALVRPHEAPRGEAASRAERVAAVERLADQRAGALVAARLDLGEGGRAVDMRLAAPEQVQVLHVVALGARAEARG